MMVGRGALSTSCRSGRAGRDRPSLFSFLQGDAKILVRHKGTCSWLCNSESAISIKHIEGIWVSLPVQQNFSSLSTRYSLPRAANLPDHSHTHPLYTSTCSWGTQCSVSCNISGAAVVRAKHWPLGFSLATYNFTHTASTGLVSHTKSASQVGQSRQPYPSWSFIWYCLKGTRGSSRSWGTGKDPRSNGAGVSDGCCGHIWNKTKQKSLYFHCHKQAYPD